MAENPILDASAGSCASDCEIEIPAEPEKVGIIFDAADELFRELRVENRFTGPDGGLVALSEGTQLEVTLEAEIADRSTN